MIEFWSVITVLVLVVGFCFLVSSMVAYNETNFVNKKRDARRGVIRAWVVILTCWAWPVWIIVLVCALIYKSIVIAVKG